MLLFKFFLFILINLLTFDAQAMLSTPPKPKRHLTVTPNHERIDKDPRRNFRRLTDDEKAASIIKIQNGIITDTSGNRLVGRFMYFLTMSNTLYMRPFLMDQGSVFHSSFDHESYPLAMACRMAGEILIDEHPANAVLINNDSGHYKPPVERLQLMEEVLIQKGYLGTIRLTDQFFLEP